MIPTRRNTGLLAGPEAQALDALMVRLPYWVTPDLLSALGVAGAVAAGLGFGLAGMVPGWWLLAILGLVLNWCGDGLDGRLARARGGKHPCRGYILDNGLDMVGYLAFAVGFACSGLVSPLLPFLALSFHFAIINLATARFAVTGVLDLAAGRIGTTELRAAFAFLALFLAAVPAEMREAPIAWGWTALDLACAGWIAAMAVTYGASLRADLRAAAQRDGDVAAPRQALLRVPDETPVLEETPG